MNRFFVCLVVLMWGFSAHGAENPLNIDLAKKNTISPKKQEVKKNPPSSFKKKIPQKTAASFTERQQGWQRMDL